MNATPAHVWPVWDWQAWVTLGLGLLALAYLVRRWWPRRHRPAAACGTGVNGGVGGAANGCSTCGSCGSGTGTPLRDHRCAAPSVPAEQPVQWQPPRPR